jgi:REP element-mobilizing transposase RayT
MFALFDPRDDVRIRRGTNLPHWYQPGVTYFVTFRTEDSIPRDVAELWHRRRRDWLARHGVRAGDWQLGLAALPRELQRQYHDTFSREYLEHLDRGYGECLLRQPELAAIVGESLRSFDGDRYELGDFVVMPNHVHVLVCLQGETEIEKLCSSWKRYMARYINQRLGRKGRFWQEESFDHLVRSVAQFEAIRCYIADNPRKAHLREGQYLYYRSPK